MRTIPALVLAAAFVLPAAAGSLAMPLAPLPVPLPATHALADWRADASAMALHGMQWLRAQQDKASGGWNVNPTGPSFPAISGLVLSGLIAEEIKHDRDPMADAVIASGVKYLLSKQQTDGGIYDKLLPSYNTAISASALAAINTPEARAAVAKAVEFLKSIQYGEGAVVYDNNPDAAQKVDKNHPFYGGWGYGNHGRPDISNTSFVLEAFHSAGVPESDPSFQRALVFLSRLQMDGSINDQPYAKDSRQGGFIYASATGKEDAGAGQSHAAGQIEESLDNGEKVSRMRAYGSVSYAGFKSLIYAGLKKDDPRIAAVQRWIAANYSVQENPGMGQAGLYYYYIAMARALNAFGADTIDVSTPNTTPNTNPDAAPSEKANWGQDLTSQLKLLQSADGSFKSVNKRWMEDNGVLITAYSVIALQAAAHERP